MASTDAANTLTARPVPRGREAESRIGAPADLPGVHAGLAVTAELHHRRTLRLTRSLVLPAGQTAADQATAWADDADRRAAEWHADTVERIGTNDGTPFACTCQRAAVDPGAVPDDPPPPRTRVFHLTAPDAIRDALDQLQDIVNGDAGPSMLPVIRASMTEALLGERP